MFLAAALQMTSGADKAHNRDTAARLVRAAADAGAKLIGLPETWPFIGPESQKLAAAEPLDGPALTLVRELARERSVWILAGSIAEATPDGKRVHNTSVLFAP